MYNLLRSFCCRVGCLVPLFVVFFLADLAFCTPSDDLLAKLQHHGLVNDFAGVIDPGDEILISNLVVEVQQKTTAAIAVVTLRSLEGGDVVEFAGKLFEKWGLGEKGKNNGVLLLASIDDRKLRIEVGYGLEGAINDAKAGRILDEQLIPGFKEQQYGAGLYNATVALAALVAGEYKVALTNNVVPRMAATHSTTSNSSSNIVPILFFVGFVVVIIIIAKKAKKMGPGPGQSSGPFGGSSSGGGFSGGSSSRSSGSGGFGGGRSGGGGASRSW